MRESHSVIRSILQQASPVDIGLFLMANLVNLLIAGVFVARGRSNPELEYNLGLATVAFALPIAAAVVWNSLSRREWWAILLPVPMVAYLVFEFVLDYWLKIDFRSTWLRWPYIGLFYLGLLLMIGFSFRLGRVPGFVTLATYFASLAATWYGHNG
jgi:hypothetical protein